MALNTGRMRHRVVIERRTTAQADTGEPLDQWELFATRRAERLATPGNELWAAQQQAGRVPTVFKLRYLAGVLPSMRLSCDGKLYDIVSAVPDAQNSELLITTQELVGEPVP